MNFLQGLGGVGAGLITANQILRQQKLDEENAKLLKSQIGLADLQLAKATKEAENTAAYGEIADQNMPGTQTIARANAPVDEWGNPEIETIAKPGDTLGAFDKMAAEALKRGDQAGYAKFTEYSKHLKAAQNEGVLDLARNVYAGTVDPGDAEKLFNATGKMRVAPGTVKWDADAGVLSGVDAVTGQPISMDKQMAERYMRMSGAIKPDEYSSAGDGQVFNKRTGEVKGDQRKPIVVNGTVGHFVTNKDGSRTFVKDFTAPNQPSVVIHQGDGKGSTSAANMQIIQSADGSYMMVDKRNPNAAALSLKDADGNAVRAKTKDDISTAASVYKAEYPYGGYEGGFGAWHKKEWPAISGKQSGGTQGGGIDDAARYLNAATSQDDFNQRAKALKAKGWTNEQIKAAAK